MSDREQPYEAYRPTPGPDAPPAQPRAPGSDPSPCAAPSAYGSSPYGAPSAYAQPAPPYALGARDHPQAVIVLILGIAGVMGFPVCSPIAWVLGSRARKEIAGSNGAYRTSGLNTVGWVLGIIGSVLLAIALLAGLAFVVVLLVLLAHGS